MLVASATTQKQEIVCEDINNFIQYDCNYSRLVDEALMDEQIQTQQYSTVTAVSSIHVRWVHACINEAECKCTQWVNAEYVLKMNSDRNRTNENDYKMNEWHAWYLEGCKESEKHDVREISCTNCDQVHKEYLMQEKCESTNGMNK